MLEHYITLLKSSQVVAFPTETVYGLGAMADDPDAVKKVFQAKQRPADNPLIVHVASVSMMEDFALKLPKKAQLLIDSLWPGPLTLIFKKKSDVLDLVTGGLDTVAIRWPSHPLAQDLIARTGPLVAPSANSSGKPSPTRPEHIKEDLGDNFPIIEAGETQVGLESTVLDVSQHPFTLYRPGGVSQNQIEHIIGETIETVKPKKVKSPKSPGMKYSHYAPQATVQWLSKSSALDQSNTIYLLHRQTTKRTSENIIHFKEDYTKMAHQLFDRFRSADHQGYNKIAIEPFCDQTLKDEPLAAALNNRVTKAIGI